MRLITVSLCLIYAVSVCILAEGLQEVPNPTGNSDQTDENSFFFNGDTTLTSLLYIYPISPTPPILSRYNKKQVFSYDI